MWKFANPIQAHQILETRWPTAEEAAQIAPISARSRSAALKPEAAPGFRRWCPWRATDDGFVTKQNLDWYRRFAEGRPGVLVVEATGVRDIPSGPLLRIGDDRFIPGLAQTCRRCTEASEGETLLFIQIIDFLAVKRRPEKAKYLQRFLKLTTSSSCIAEVTDSRAWSEGQRESKSVSFSEMLTMNLSRSA